MPDSFDWGPAFWRILHGLAESAGGYTDVNAQKDEQLLWKNLMINLPKTLPCDECRNHLKDYIVLHPIEIPESYDNLKHYVRLWYYELHEDVNRRLEKPSFPFENLAPEPCLKKAFSDLSIILKQEIQVGNASLLAWLKWSKYVRFLVGMY